MQTVTLNYLSTSKDHPTRHVLAALVPPKQRRSFLSHHSTHSLPPIQSNGKRPSSIRIRGTQLTASKLNESSVNSFHPPPSRPRSLVSNSSERSRARSRSVSGSRSHSKLVRLKFGHPVKVRSADFYASGLSEAELRLREDSFVNDSIRCAHQSRRSSAYEPLDDPYLRDFFQTSLVLDIVQKTLDLDLEQRRVPRKKRSKTLDSAVDDYRRIVAKRSSGYAQLNGYDCFPSYARRRRPQEQKPQTSSLIRFPAGSRLPRLAKKKSRRSKPLDDRKQSTSDITTSTVF